MCTDGTHVPVCTADWFYCSTVPGTTEQVSHRRGDTGAVVLATKFRLENGNNHIIEKKKAMTAAVRRKRKLLRWKQETGEVRNRCNILGYQ